MYELSDLLREREVLIRKSSDYLDFIDELILWERFIIFCNTGSYG